MGQTIRGKVGASDLVQETFLQAQQIFDRFEGKTQEELLAWLTRILQFKVAQVADQFLTTQRRDIAREVAIASVDQNEIRDPSRYGIAATDSAIEEADDLEKLRALLSRLPREYQQVIELRSLEQMSFADVGEALGRSSEAARKLWVRALDQVREIAQQCAGER